MKRKILICVVAIFVIIQFFRPTKNLSDDNTFDISTKYAMSPEVSKVLHEACYNCHSNKTGYPWYSEVQPVAWWLAHHVDEGKQHLNFSTFTTRRIAIQNHKLEETIEMVKDKKMPLRSYTWLGLHPEAKITDAQRELIIDWAAAQMDTLKMHYPPDSLKMPKRVAVQSK